MGAANTEKSNKTDKLDKKATTADVVEISPQVVHCAGVDDGHFGIKIVTENDKGELIRGFVPSRVSLGSSVISLSEQEDNVYGTDDQFYTVSETMPNIDTRFPDYPLSAINRVLVHHALINVGLAGKPVKIVTGLPVDDYFIGNRPNEDLIDRKVANLLERPVTNRNDTVQCAKVVAHSVQSEAIAAFYDLLINDDGSVNAEIEELVASGSIGFIDIGGKTTDFAVVVNGGTGIDPARSGTANMGALSLNVAVEAALRSSFGITQLSPAQVDKAVMTGVCRLFGKDNDCQKLVDHEKNLLAQQIIESTRQKMRDAADLERVFFVGGGSLLLQDQLKNLYPHGVFVGDPQYANARGMFKIAKYMMQ